MAGAELLQPEHEEHSPQVESRQIHRQPLSSVSLVIQVFGVGSVLRVKVIAIAESWIGERMGWMKQRKKFLSLKSVVESLTMETGTALERGMEKFQE